MEVDDLKKVSNSLSVLLSEKQKQEKVSAFMISLINSHLLLIFSRGAVYLDQSPNMF